MYHMMYSMMKPLTPMFAEPFFRDFFGEPQRRPHRPAMQMRLHETDTAYLLESDLPGVGRDNIALSVDGNVLTITALRRSPETAKPQEGENQSPRHEHRMERRFELEGIDTAAIAADYVDGVLKVTLPKEQPADKPAPRQIAIGGSEQVALTE